MPKVTKKDPIDPRTRINWSSLNEGQKRYAWEQFMKAQVYRGKYFTPPVSPGDSRSDEQFEQQQTFNFVQYMNDFNDELLAQLEKPDDTVRSDIVLPESITGVPQDTEIQNKRPAEGPIREPESKQSRIEEQDMATAPKQAKTNTATSSKTNNASKSKTAGDAGSTSGGTGIANAVLQYYTSKGLNADGNKISYQHAFRCRSYGNTLLPQVGATSATAISPSYCVYPYVSLPVEYLWFYIPKGIFDALKILPNCKPIAIECKVTPIGQMVSFSTNTSTTNSGTTSHTLYGLGNVGLNYKLPTDKVTITRNATNPIVVDSASQFSNSSTWIQRLWGTHLDSSQTAPTTTSLNTILQSAQNAEIIIPNTYLRVQFPVRPLYDATQINSDVSTAGSYWSMGRYLTKCPIHPHTGIPICQMQFASDDWPVLAESTAVRRYLPGSTTAAIPVARRGKRGSQKATSNQTFGAANYQTNQTDSDQTSLALDYHSTSDYELWCLNTQPKFHYLAQEQRVTGVTVPSVVFGIEAVQANVPEATASDYINASCDWFVETNIVFEYNIGNEFNHGTSPNVFQQRIGTEDIAYGKDLGSGISITNRELPTRFGHQLF